MFLLLLVCVRRRTAIHHGSKWNPGCRRRLSNLYLPSPSAEQLFVFSKQVRRRKRDQRVRDGGAAHRLGGGFGLRGLDVEVCHHRLQTLFIFSQLQKTKENQGLQSNKMWIFILW